MNIKTILIQFVFQCLILLSLFINTFVEGKQWTQMATDGSQPQKAAITIKPLPSDSVMFQTTCKHDNINISSTCGSGFTDDHGKCNLFKTRSSLNGPNNSDSRNTYQYSHFPCRTWKITDTTNKKIRLHFNGFHDKNCCSKLSIFDGPDQTYDTLFSEINIGNYLMPTNVTSSGTILYLHYISNISLMSSELPGFHMSYSPEEEGDFYQYDYLDVEVDDIVLDLPDYYDDTSGMLGSQSQSMSDVIDNYNDMSPQETFSKFPFIKFHLNPKQSKNSGEYKKLGDSTLGKI